MSCSKPDFHISTSSFAHRKLNIKDANPPVTTSLPPKQKQSLKLRPGLTLLPNFHGKAKTTS